MESVQKSEHGGNILCLNGYSLRITDAKSGATNNKTTENGSSGRDERHRDLGQRTQLCRGVCWYLLLPYAVHFYTLKQFSCETGKSNWSKNVRQAALCQAKHANCGTSMHVISVDKDLPCVPSTLCVQDDSRLAAKLRQKKRQSPGFIFSEDFTLSLVTIAQQTLTTTTVL